MAGSNSPLPRPPLWCHSGAVLELKWSMGRLDVKRNKGWAPLISSWRNLFVKIDTTSCVVTWRAKPLKGPMLLTCSQKLKRALREIGSELHLHWGMFGLENQKRTVPARRDTGSVDMIWLQRWTSLVKVGCSYVKWCWYVPIYFKRSSASSMLYIITTSTAQGGGGSFKNRKPIGRVGCCDSRMAERIHWWTERWLELCFLEWLQWLQSSPHNNCWM